MANRPAPEVQMLGDLDIIRENYVREIWEDGEVDAEERRGLRVIDNLRSFVDEVKARRAFAAAIVKQVETEAYLNDLAAPFGLQIVSMEAYREDSKIVDFPQRKPGA